MSDVISRHGTSAWLENMGYPNLAKMIMDEKRFPSAEPEPKKGKWIDTGGYRAWYAREYRCSKCGGTMLGEANFCPNCGADMRGEQDE